MNRARFLERASRACRQAWLTIRDNWTEYSSTQDLRLSKAERFDEAARVSLLAGIEFHIFDNLYRLGGPRGGERQVEEIIGTLQSAIERGQKELAPVRSVPLILKLFSDYNSLAGPYGLRDCLVTKGHLGQIAAR